MTMKKRLAVTLQNSYHGNPGRNCLPSGFLIQVEPASNLPADSEIQFWASPARGHPWPKGLKTADVGLSVDDVFLVMSGRAAQ